MNKWRLPTIEELLSLVDYNKHNPVTNMENISSDDYWSSTTNAGSTNYAWYVGFNGGYSSSCYKGNTNSVRCVRTLEDGTLEWAEKDAPKKMSWNEAMEYAESLNNTTTETDVGAAKSEVDMFKQHGFEKPEFECEILKKMKYGFIGYVNSKNGYTAIVWNDFGTAFYGEDRKSEYNLIPIKEWYEDENNFPCLVAHRTSCIVYKANTINIDKGELLIENEWVNLERYRLATKEDVSSLIIGG